MSTDYVDIERRHLAMRTPYHIRHRPRKRAIQYSEAAVMESGSCGVLDTPLSRRMTVGVGAARSAASGERAPYSAGFAAGGGGAADGGGAAFLAAARFSTMRTA